MLREKSISIPEGAVRLREMLDFADRGSWALDQLRLTLPIVLEEFHSSRDPLPGVPWTPDDGVTRMAVLAYHGDRHVWGLAGFRRTPVRDVKVSDKDMTYMAGTHPDDRRALNEHLGRPKSRRRFIEGTSAAEKSTIALGQLPGLPIRAESTLDATLKRVELRRRHCATASADGLFRPTDNHGRVLANLVALAEFVRTRGAGAFTVDPAHSHSTTQDEAVSAAGTIAQAALSVGGDLSSGYGEAAVLTAYPATIHLVHQLANGAHDADPDPVPAIVNAAPARRALDLANNQRGAAPWLGRQLSRAYLVAAGASRWTLRRPPGSRLSTCAPMTTGRAGSWLTPSALRIRRSSDCPGRGSAGRYAQIWPRCTGRSCQAGRAASRSACASAKNDGSLAAHAACCAAESAKASSRSWRAAATAIDPPRRRAHARRYAAVPWSTSNSTRSVTDSAYGTSATFCAASWTYSSLRRTGPTRKEAAAAPAPHRVGPRVARVAGRAGPVPHCGRRPGCRKCPASTPPP